MTSIATTIERLQTYFQALVFRIFKQSRIEKVLPRDSVSLTAEQLAEARRICDWNRELLERRDSYLRQTGLDPGIWNPTANWSVDSPIFEGYRALVCGRQEHLNLLRVFAQVFTGHFLGIRNSLNARTLREIPADVDQQVAYALRRKLARYFIRYLRLIRAVPALASLTPPQAFGESGYRINGVIVNHDTQVYLERVALLHASGVLDALKAKANPVVLEIGSGYGALAFYLKAIGVRGIYVCLDLPESLLFSTLYLCRYHKNVVLMKECSDLAEMSKSEIAFAPNYLFDRLRQLGLKVDLAINTLSMSEMSEPQVRHYCHGLTQMLAPDGVFFEQNQDNRHLGLLFAPEIIGDYFSQRRRLALPVRLTQGAASIWSRPTPANT
jgi:hypothetical protein